MRSLIFCKIGARGETLQKQNLTFGIFRGIIKLQKREQKGNEIMYTQITLREARKFYNDGWTIYLLPSKAAIGSCWISPLPVSGCGDFDRKVNAYKYYNCNEYVGKSVHYYIFKE
jgi:hypothetical protein